MNTNTLKHFASFFVVLISACESNDTCDRENAIDSFDANNIDEMTE